MIGDKYCPSAETLKELLVGQSILGVRTLDESDSTDGTDPVGKVVLSNGRILLVWGNDGGCSCGAGCYYLTELNDCDNIITNVEVEENPAGDEDGGDGTYKVFVYAGHQKINLLTFVGDDGNGYYGTGWWLRVSEEK